ncbi:FtsX-like permease family protein [Bdellovibrionota bacterium FG-2]
MRNLLTYIGLRHLRRKPLRTLLTALGIAFGVALFLGIKLINESVLGSFQDTIESVTGKAKLTVSAGDAGFPEERLEVIRNTKGVKHAVPMVEARAYFAGTTQETLMILGVDLLQEQSVRTYKTTDEQVIDDPLVFLNQPDSIILTHSFAKAHGLKIDSVFELATAQGKKSFTVRGLLSPEGPAKAYGGAIAIMDIDGARVSFGKEGKTDRVDIVPTAGESLEDLSSRLKDKLGPGYFAERPESQSESMERMVKSFQIMIRFFSTLALLVGVFLVANSVSISVAERRREIGTLRALGATQKGVLALFLGEAACLGFLGSLAGIFMGRALASFLVQSVTRSMTAQLLQKVEVSRIDFTWTSAITGILIGTLAAFIAALLPSIRATRIHPVEAMKRTEAAISEKSRLTRYTPHLGFLLLSFMVMTVLTGLDLRFNELQLINQGASMIGAALLGPALVVLMIRFYKNVLGVTRTIPRLALDNLLRSPTRTASNVTSLMVGLLLVIMIAIVNHSFRTSIEIWLDRTFKADLLVSSNGQITSYQVQPLDESVGFELGKIAGVRAGLNGSAYALRFIHLQYQGKQVGLKAFDPPDPKLGYFTYDLIDQKPEDAVPLLYTGGEPTVMISTNFATHFNKKTGDTLDLETPSGMIHLKVIAILTDFASPEGVLYIDRAQYRKYWKDPLVSAFGVYAEPGYPLETIRKEIDTRFGATRNIVARSNAKVKASLMTAINQSFTYTRAIEAAALIVGLMGLLNTLMISVMERTRELGTLRAVGMSKSQLIRMILAEASLLGALGAVAATLFGSLIAYLWLTHSLTHTLGWVVSFYFPWSAIFTTLLLGIVVSGLAGLYPAWKAAQIPISEALDYE